MSAVIADQASVQKMTTLAMAPKPRLNFLPATAFARNLSMEDIKLKLIAAAITAGMTLIVCIINLILTIKQRRAQEIFQDSQRVDQNKFMNQQRENQNTFQESFQKSQREAALAEKFNAELVKSRLDTIRNVHQSLEKAKNRFVALSDGSEHWIDKQMVIEAKDGLIKLADFFANLGSCKLDLPQVYIEACEKIESAFVDLFLAMSAVSKFRDMSAIKEHKLKLVEQYKECLDLYRSFENDPLKLLTTVSQPNKQANDN
jgi:hypothetical protein